MIIYPDETGRVVIVSPAPGLDVADVVAQTVPEGRPWRLIDELPAASSWLWSDDGPILPALALADYQAAVAAHVDAVAGQRNYTDGAHCASYVASTIPAWAAEAAAFVAWRDAVWSQAIATLAAVEGGAEPPTIAGLIAALPVIEW